MSTVLIQGRSTTNLDPLLGNRGKVEEINVTNGAAYVTVGTVGGAGAITALLSGVLVQGAGVAVSNPSGRSTYQATVIGTGAVSATVKVQVSNDNSSWLDLATITLSGTTSATDGFSSDAPWAYVRGNVTAISGTNAAVTLNRNI